jgi:hypothetical protein
LLPLLTLVYLPVRADAGAGMWGDPTHLAGFLRYVSGEAFLGNVAQHDRLQLFADYGLYFLQVTSGVPAIGALLLLPAAAAHERRALLGLLLGAVATLLAACLQPLEIRNPDNVAYVAPAVALFAIAGGAGFAALARRGRPMLAALGLGLTALSPYGVQELRQQLRADAPALDTLALALVDTPPPRALVVATTDFVATAWMLAQSAERARPDVALFVQGLSTSSWHWAQLDEHPGLSGRPLRAPGGDAHDGYTRGAILSALPRVSVALELDLPGRPASVAGPYALLPPTGMAEEPVQLVASIGERLLPVLARDARAGPDGDAGAAASVSRHVFATHARRLLRLGLGQDALASVRNALFRLPAAELALVRVSSAARGTGDPPVIDDRVSYLTSLEDAVRLAAAELWALSAREPARELLARQFERGDELALLQLAHLQAFDGDRAAASRTLDALLSSAPELRPQAEPLRNALARDARP